MIPSRPPRQPRVVGRDVELARLGAAVGGPGVVELVGPPGVGKSRLAAEVAASVGERALVQVKLRDVVDRAEAVARVAREMDVAAGSDPELAVELALVARSNALVVLDEGEQVPELDELAAEWCDAAPELSVLLVSRHRSRLAGTTLVELAPLGAGDGLALFQRRAAELGVPIETDGENERRATEIVAALDGLPLAIELAATRLRVVGLAELWRRVVTDAEGIASLRGALARSFALLEPAELSALAELAAFVGPIAVDIAERTLGDRELPAIEVIASLRDKSLLFERRDGDQHRLVMLRAVRAHAASAVSEAERLRAWARHAELVSERDDASLEDVRAALDRLPAIGLPGRSTVAVALAEKLGRAAQRRGVPSDVERIESVVRAVGASSEPSLVLLEARAEVRRWSDRADDSVDAVRSFLVAAERAGDRPAAARALFALGNELYRAFRMDEARPTLERALEEARALDDHSLFALIACRLSAVYAAIESFDRAEALLEEAAIASARVREEYLQARVEAGLGTIALERPNGAALAIVRYRSARERAMRSGAQRLASVVRAYEGFAELSRGDFARAEAVLLDAVAEARALGYALAAGFFLAGVAAARARRGDPEAGSALLPDVFSCVDHDAAYRVVCDVLAAHVDVAEADAALALGEVSRARTRFLDVTRRVALAKQARLRTHKGDGPRVVEVSDDLRIALGLLVPALESLRERITAAAGTVRPPPGAPRLRVTHGATELQLGDERAISLAGRPVVSRLLWALAERHLAGRAASSEELVSATWPGERLRGRRGKARLYVALNDLRKLGLRDVLESVPGEGYCLRCDLEIR